MTSRWWFYPTLIGVSLGLVAAGVAALTVVLLWPNLPSLEVLTDYRPKIPLRIFSASPYRTKLFDVAHKDQAGFGLLRRDQQSRHVMCR